MRPGIQSCAVLFSLGILGCGDGGGDETKHPAQESCSDLEFEALEALPLDSIGLSGIPESFGDQLAARIEAEGATTTTMILQLGDDPTLIAPIHPQGLVEGGPVTLQVEDDAGNRCPPLPFTILPLPPSPGAAEASLDLLGDLLETQLAFFGTSLEELRGVDPTELPVELLPLFVAQNSLDDPENPDSFAALLAGTAPALGEVTPDRELVDALLGHLGLLALLETSLDEWDELMEERPSETQHRVSAASIQQGLDGGGPQTAAELNYQMELAAWGRSHGPDTPTGQYLRDLSLGVGVVGLVPAPPVQMGAAVTGAALFAFIKTTEAAAKLYPSRFVSMEFEVDREVWEADSPHVGQWFDVEVVATSEGWSLDQTVLETILQAAGMGSAYKGWLTSFDPDGFVSGVVDFMRSEAVSRIIDAAAGDSGHLNIAPEETAPVDITDEPWSEATYHFAFQEDGRQSFRLDPAWPGEIAAKLVISTNPEMFGRRRIESSWEPEILPIQIVISPDAITVEPGDVVEFEVEVLNAFDTSIEASALHGTIGAITETSHGLYSLSYTAPSSEERLPDAITVTGLTADGMYADSTRDPPLAQAIIRGEEVIVEIHVEAACIPGGSKETFTAVVHNLDDQAVTWEVSEGSVSAAGVFTAPRDGGTVIVTATSVEDPTASASITVMTGNCDCLFTSNLYGSAGRLDGGNILIGMEDGKIGSMQFASDLSNLDMTEWNTYRKQITLWGEGSALDDPGTFTSEARPSYVGAGFEFSTFGEETLTVSLSRFERVNASTVLIEGRITGTIYWVSRYGQDHEEYQSKEWSEELLLDFSAELDEMFGVFQCESNSG